MTTETPQPPSLREAVEAKLSAAEMLHQEAIRDNRHHDTTYWQHFREGQVDAYNQVLALLPSSEAPALQWSRERPAEADWYMVRGPGFRVCIEFQEIAGMIWPKLPYTWEQLEGCEYSPVAWPQDPRSEEGVR